MKRYHLKNKITLTPRPARPAVISSINLLDQYQDKKFPVRNHTMKFTTDDGIKFMNYYNEDFQKIRVSEYIECIGDDRLLAYYIVALLSSSSTIVGTSIVYYTSTYCLSSTRTWLPKHENIVSCRGGVVGTSNL